MTAGVAIVLVALAIAWLCAIVNLFLSLTWR